MKIMKLLSKFIKKYLLNVLILQIEITFYNYIEILVY